MTVRTRNDTATFTVNCADETPHRFTIHLDGTIDNPHHDAEQDAVIAALGGQLHACAAAQSAYDAARACIDAITGTRDIPRMRRSTRHIWTDNTTCPHCPGVATGRAGPAGIGAAHVATTAHQAHRRGASPRDTETLFRWLNRNNPGGPAPKPGTRASDDAILAALGLARGSGSRWLWLARRDLLTPRYVSLAAPLVGAQPQRILALREGGARVEWLADLLPRVSARTLRRLRDTGERFPHSLAAARNVSPRVIADYLNSGVTAHFHTYASHHATPQQILAVYRATSGNRTLADYLNSETVTIPEALRRAGAAA